MVSYVNQAPPHVYVMAGIPDITNLVKGYKFGKRYKESILSGKPIEIIEKVQNSLQSVQTLSGRLAENLYSARSLTATSPNITTTY